MQVRQPHSDGEGTEDMIRFDTGALNTTVVAMRTIRTSVQTAERASIMAGGAVLLTAVRANMSLRDHTQRDLDRLNHPYARKHGSIQIHTSGGMGGGQRVGGGKLIANASSRIHSQTGTLLNATRGQFKGGLRPSYVVMADVGLAPHAAYVIQGTEHMLKRDVLWDTATAPGVKRAIRKVIVTVLGKVLRTKAVIRFGGSRRSASPGGGLEA